MKKMFQLLIILFIIYFGIEFIYNFFGHGHDVNYTLDIDGKEIKIHEVLSLNNKEQDNYFIEITRDDVSIPFKIYETYSKRQKIVKELTFMIDDDYTCVYLNIKEANNQGEIKCNKKGTVYDYIDVVGKSDKIDSKVKELGFDVNKNLTSNDNTVNKLSNLKVFTNDFPKDMYMVLDNYRGVYLLGDDVNQYIRTIQFFNQDVYSKELSAVVGKYYVVANYNANHEFHEFHLLNMTVGDTSKFKFDEYISFNSFVQGVHDNKLYIIDKDNKIQYCVDPYKKTVTVTNDPNGNVIVYKNGKEEMVKVRQVIDNHMVFVDEYEEYKGTKYSKVVLVGDEKVGTYYLFKYNGSTYDVYVAYPDSNVKTYAFTTTSKDKVQISNSYVYYLNDDKIMVYSQSFGRKAILEYSELRHNDDLKFLVY